MISHEETGFPPSGPDAGGAVVLRPDFGARRAAAPAPARLTVAAAAALMRRVYQGGRWPEGFEPVGRRYDSGWASAELALDQARGVRVGLVRGTTRRRHWARNLDARPWLVRGPDGWRYIVHKGFLKGALELLPFLLGEGAAELVGHSKGASEVTLAGWLAGRGDLGGGPAARMLDTVALAPAASFFARRPPAMRCLAVVTPDDLVPRLAAGPCWYHGGSLLTLAWEPPDLEDDHRIGPMLAALERAGMGHVTLGERSP